MSKEALEAYPEHQVNSWKKFINGNTVSGAITTSVLTINAVVMDSPLLAVVATLNVVGTVYSWKTENSVNKLPTYRQR